MLKTGSGFLQSAVEIDPEVFNAYNALGYAWLEKGEVFRAIEAFNKAIEYHPEEKAGYFDLAAVYLQENKPELSLQYLERAVIKDPSSREDLRDNPQFDSLADHPKYQALLNRQ